MTVSRYRMKHSGPECQYCFPWIGEGDCLMDSTGSALWSLTSTSSSRMVCSDFNLMLLKTLSI